MKSLSHQARAAEETFSTVSSSERTSKNNKLLPRKSRPWRLCFTAFLTFLLCWAFLSLWLQISELGPSAVFNNLNPFGSQGPQVVIHLQEQPVYKIKKKQKILGVQVYRITNSQLPQEFLVLSGVSSTLLDKIFAKPLDRFWANQTAQQLLLLRSSSSSDELGSGGKEPTIEVQSVENEQMAPLLIHGKAKPYWQLKIRFQLSTEILPRYYQVGVLRPLEGFQLKSENKESIIIAYAPQNTYQKSLLASLLKVLRASRS